jgi:hypothetical protein
MTEIHFVALFITLIVLNIYQKYKPTTDLEKHYVISLMSYTQHNHVWFIYYWSILLVSNQ